MKFDHLGYLVRDTAQSVQALSSFFPNITLLRTAHDFQGAYITRVSTLDGGMTAELVEPFPNNKLLVGKLNREKQECLPYHISFVVDDFESTYNKMRELGWIALTLPFDTLHLGTQASHLYKPAAGIVEIVGIKTS